MKKTISVVITLLAMVSTAQAQQNSGNMSIDPMWLHVPEAVEGDEFVMTEQVLGSDIPMEIRMVEMFDGVYSPIGIRKPEGDGPFPTIVFAHMNGGYGLRWLREWANYGSGTLEQFLEEGYAVVWMRYRAEVDTPYGSELSVREFQGRDRWSRGPLEYEDSIAIVEYVRELPDVDADRIGWLGVSHGSEMLLKVASEYTGIRAGVATEPAAMDYLARLPDPPGSGPSGPEPETMEINTKEMQEEAVLELRGLIDRDAAMRRINAIETPILVVGRDRDHNQATFRLSYELMVEAGKDAEWQTYDHDHHGFIFVQRDSSGRYNPDPIQRDAVAAAIEFFERHLK